MSITTVLLVAASLHAVPGTDSARTPVPGGERPSRGAAHALTSAAEVGMSATALVHAEEEVWSDMQRGAFPGAALAIGRGPRVVLEEGLGTIGRGPGDSDAVDPDRTVYDLASLTKVVGTTTALMLLVEDGKIRLDEPVSRFLPEFTGSGREFVTLRHLLTHTSGLPDGINIPSGLSPEQALRYVMATPLRSAPGMRVEYSDLSFVLLYAAAERAAGEPLYRLLDRRVFGPLQMRSTTYWPGDGCGRCAPTSRDGANFRGRVHDPISRRMGGITGNAGLFATVHDVARFAAMLANGGELDGVRVLQRGTIRSFTQRQPGTGTRALGWDTPGRPGTNMFGNRVSDRSFGHTGYTGTSIWIDPELGTWVVLLANRTYDSEGNNRMQQLRRSVADHVVDSAASGPRMAWAGGGD
jgi:CubicO group peptidase (beta-lactamase class C family)